MAKKTQATNADNATLAANDFISALMDALNEGKSTSGQTIKKSVKAVLDEIT